MTDDRVVVAVTSPEGEDEFYILEPDKVELMQRGKSKGPSAIREFVREFGKKTDREQAIQTVQAQCSRGLTIADNSSGPYNKELYEIEMPFEYSKVHEVQFPKKEKTYDHKVRRGKW